MSLVLVIEDDRTQRLVAGLALKKAGYEVLEAGDGLQGLETARRELPDLIVCDVMMPGLNGYQLVAALRQEAGICDIPVILLTAMTERAHMRIGMTSGADDYLPKPFSFSELTDAAAALISKRNVQRQEIVSSIKSKFLAALDEQKQELARQYEQRFFQELNARWERSGDANAELKYDDATVLVVDLFGQLLARLPPDAEAGATVRQAYQIARDTLYLFGAKHLLPQGNDLVAIFAESRDFAGVSPRLRALRAAFSLVKAITALLKATLPSEPNGQDAGNAVTIALHEGPITLLLVSDPLHGDPDSTVATGETLIAAESLREFAQESNWHIASSRTMVAGMEQRMTTGRSAAVPLGATRALLEAVELLAVN